MPCVEALVALSNSLHVNDEELSGLVATDCFILHVVSEHVGIAVGTFDARSVARCRINLQQIGLHECAADGVDHVFRRVISQTESGHGVVVFHLAVVELLKGLCIVDNPVWLLLVEVCAVVVFAGVDLAVVISRATAYVTGLQWSGVLSLILVVILESVITGFTGIIGVYLEVIHA